MVWEFHRLSECEEKRALVQAFRRTLFRCLIGQSQVILKFGFCGRANDSRATAVCVLGWAQASDPLSSLSFLLRCVAVRSGRGEAHPKLLRQDAGGGGEKGDHCYQGRYYALCPIGHHVALRPTRGTYLFKHASRRMRHVCGWIVVAVDPAKFPVMRLYDSDGGFHCMAALLPMSHVCLLSQVTC